MLFFLFVFLFLNLFYRLGPLSIEQKKRTQVKRAKLEKHKEDERKPQEIREEDIARSENETTRNVAKVCTFDRQSFLRDI
jgi:hypothetical protein